MAHDCRYDKEIDVIRVRHHGKSDVEDFRQARNRVVRLQKEHDNVRVVVDLQDVTDAPPTLDIYQFASELPIQLHIAMVCDSELQEDLKFLETVAMNRGRRIKLFANEADALGWLRS
jgi:hypothetical protein